MRRLVRRCICKRERLNRVESWRLPPREPNSRYRVWNREIGGVVHLGVVIRVDRDRRRSSLIHLGGGVVHLALSDITTNCPHGTNFRIRPFFRSIIRRSVRDTLLKSGQRRIDARRLHPTLLETARFTDSAAVDYPIITC